MERRASPLEAVKPASVQNCGTKIGSVGASIAYSGISVGNARCWNTRLNSSSASRAASSPWYKRTMVRANCILASRGCNSPLSRRFSMSSCSSIGMSVTSMK